MPSPTNDQPKKNKDGKKDSLEEKIRRHLTDKNDKITDEDIRDVVVGQARGTNVPEAEAGGKTINEQADEMQKEIPKDKKGGAWDVLGPE